MITDPHPATAENRALEQAANWMREHAIHPSRLVATHVFFYDYLPLRVKSDGLWVEWPEPEDMGEETIVVWDSHYSNRWGLEYEFMISRPNEWTVLAKFEDGKAVIFKRIDQ